MTFQANSADYGGALYVADETNSHICASESYKVASTTTECFMQLLSPHGDDTDAVFIIFTENNARISGSDLFGGLLDRCTVSLFAAIYRNFRYSNIPNIYGVAYLYGIAKFWHVIHNSMTISSHPVRVCFCNETQQPDCGYYPSPIQVKRGENFKLAIVAVDQINQTISNVTIRSFLLSSQGGLGENQLNQSTGEACTNLTFSVTSPRESEQLVLYADGPCKDAPLSRKTIIVNFTACNCPVGFQQNHAKNTNCECECNSFLHPYVTKCDPKVGTILRESNFWIDYIDGYLIHPHCPFDYCKASKEKVEINLGVQNGADAQCDINRAGILCGTCTANYSLSLGSSRCISCPTHWPAMLVALLLFSLLAGVLLITLILTLNLTVAVGTLNGIIFYSNIVAANTNIVFPSNPIIAWLNLEPGFDICFFEGMNAYWKTWLQLAFPAYVIILVAMVIIISEKSKRFSDLIGKRDPVATLATLVLLSYAKLLHTIIASLSGTFLDYPDPKAHDMIVWLPDASVKYLSGEHVPLFIMAILILLAGILYTTIVFAWQWILGLKWVKATKLSLFIHTYHAPYTPKHRYWTGLLLIARIVLYIIFAANIQGDPRVNLIAVGVMVAGILLLKYLVEGSSHIYQRWPVEILEVACHFNLIFLSIVSFFTLENKAIKAILAHVSMSVTIMLLVGVLLYHFFNEIAFKTKLWKRYKQATLGQRQLMLDATLDTTTEDSDFSVPSCTVVEGPKEHALLLRGKQEGRAVKKTSSTVNADHELRETLLDKAEA